MQKRSTLKEQGENWHTVFANNFATLKKMTSSKPVARHFNLPNHSTHNITIYGLSLHQGKRESRKNVGNECFNSTLLTLTEPMNASRSTNLFINSNHHLIGHFGKYHNTFCLSPEILHKHCFQFLLGLTMVPKENENNAYAKFGGTKKKYYDIFRSGLWHGYSTPYINTHNSQSLY